jgi:acyl-coenzyme A thioesterase PaaI-like protein
VSDADDARQPANAAAGNPAAGGDEAERAARDARRRFAAVLREILALDADGFTPIDALDDLARRAEQIRDVLAASPKGRRVRAHHHNPERRFRPELREDNPMGGRSSALAPPIVMTVEGDRARATVTFSGAYQGPPNSVHGGYIAAAFDELLGVAHALAGRPGMTGTLSVRYIRPVPVETPIEMLGWYTRTEGRKTFVEGTMHANGELLARSEGVWIAVDWAKRAGVPREGDVS